MSSLEEDIFFGSRQLALDSYLKAREELNDDSQLPHKKGVVYPNVLDEISYQKSFERDYRSGYRRGDRSGDKSVSLPPQQGSITMNNRSQLSLSGSFYLSISQLHFKSDAIKEGCCIEVTCQLGELRIAELCFYSQKNPINVTDYFKVTLLQQSFYAFFKTSKASCLKVEVSAKEYKYDSKIGSSFMPIESVIMFLEELNQSKLYTLQKKVELRLLSQKRPRHGTDPTISFLLVLSKGAPLPQQPQTFRMIAQSVDKQKVQIKVHEVQMKLSYKTIEVEYKDKRYPVTPGSSFTLDLEKNNMTLNSGLDLQVIVDGDSVGSVSVSVLHLFLSQSIHGKFPIVHRGTAEYLGCIEMELSEPVIAASKQLREMQSEDTARIGKNIHKDRKKETMLSVQIVSAMEILYLCDSDLTLTRFYLIVHRNKEVRTSNEFKFKRIDRTNLYASQQPIDIDYAPTMIEHAPIQLVLELYQKGTQYDQIRAYSKLEFGLPLAQSAWSEELQADCNVNVKGDIVKILLTISALTYPEGYLIEDKIGRVTQLFHGGIKLKLQQHLAKESEQQVLKRELGLTFMEIDRLQLMFSNGEDGKSLLQVLSKKEEGWQHPPINQQDFFKELEYADSNGTGYATQQQIRTMLGYFGCDAFNPKPYLADNSVRIKDLVHRSRTYSEGAISYLRLLRDLTQPLLQQRDLSGKSVDKPKLIHKSEPSLEQLSSLKHTRLIILRAVNLNTLNNHINSPNSYIVEEQTGKATQVCYRNCNPQYLCELLIEQPASEILKFRVMHKDFKTTDSLLGELSLSLNNLHATRCEQSIRISLNDNAYVEFQRR